MLQAIVNREGWKAKRHEALRGISLDAFRVVLRNHLILLED